MKICVVSSLKIFENWIRNECRGTRDQFQLVVKINETDVTFLIKDDVKS